MNLKHTKQGALLFEGTVVWSVYLKPSLDLGQGSNSSPFFKYFHLSYSRYYKPLSTISHPPKIKLRNRFYEFLCGNIWAEKYFFD